MTDEPKVLVETRGNILLITLNRPAARNAVDAECCEIIGNAVEAADKDVDIRAIVVTGAGDQSFCAGADLKAIGRGERPLPEGMEHWSFAGFVNHFTSKPTIAAVNGTALGGGTELALSCDLVVAAENAAFGLPEVKRGLLAAAGGAFRLGAQVPFKIALELMLTGEPLSAADANRWGLVNRVVPVGEALPAALALAELISANAPLAVQATKRIAYGVIDGQRGDEDAGWALTSTEMGAVFRSEDAKEGPRAFAEKRAPVWQGR
ncbi:MAG: Enoyl-CoA hydratase [Pseudonocardiales bacterium]|nr:Enoyl-CoA hydratase [Pseudonocardiales bacterium]